MTSSASLPLQLLLRAWRGLHLHHVLLFYGTVTTILAWIGVTHCTFVQGVHSSRLRESYFEEDVFREVEKDIEGNEERDERTYTVGLFRMAVFAHNTDTRFAQLLGCVRFPDDVHLDQWLHQAQWAGVLSACCATLGWMLMAGCLLWWKRNNYRTWMWSRMYLGAAALLATWTLISVMQSGPCQSETKCRLSGVGILTAFNVVLLSGLTLLLCMEDRPRVPWLAWWSDVEQNDLEKKSSDGLFLSKPQNDVANRVENEIQGEQDNNSNSTGSLSSDHCESNDEEDVFQNEIEDKSSSQGLDTKEGEQHKDEENKHPLEKQHEHVLHHFPHPEPVISEEVPEDEDALVVSAVSLGKQRGLQPWHRSKWFRFGLLLLMGVIWVVSIMGAKNCTFLFMGQSSSPSQDIALGLYTRGYYVQQDFVGCISYSKNSHIDHHPHGYALFQMSRVFGAVAALLTTIQFVVGLVQLVLASFQTELWIFLRALGPLTAISQALVLVILRSELCTNEDASAASQTLNHFRQHHLHQHDHHQHQKQVEQLQQQDVECHLGGIGWGVVVNVILLVGFSALCWYLSPPLTPVFAPYQPSSAELKEMQDAEEDNEPDNKNFLRKLTKLRRRGRNTAATTTMIQSIKPPRNEPLDTILDAPNEDQSVISDSDLPPEFKDSPDPQQQQQEPDPLSSNANNDDPQEGIGDGENDQNEIPEQDVEDPDEKSLVEVGLGDAVADNESREEWRSEIC